MKNNIIIAVVVALILGGVGGFLGGMQYQKSQESNTVTLNNAQGGMAGRGQFVQRFGGNENNRPVTGEIIDTDDKSITVRLDDESSKIVLISDQTTINKSSQGSKEDLKTGEMVAAFGTTNSDGSVTAENISLNPQNRIFQQISPAPSK